jgi:exonuclease SbcD
VNIPSAASLRTIRGTLDELAAFTNVDGWLRVYVRERPRAGLREAVQEMLPQALEVRIDPDILAEAAPGTNRAPRQIGRSAGELFGEYLTAAGHADPAVAELFDRLHAEVQA